MKSSIIIFVKLCEIVGGINMRWLHFSDIHFDFANDGTSTKRLHDNFKEFVKKNNITVDEVFFTGDFRNAKNQEGQDLKTVAKEATDFIKEIALSVGVKDTSHIHIVPGNHDFITDDNEEELKKICKNYNGNFLIKDKIILKKRFGFFVQCSKFLNNKVWENFYDGNIHRFQIFNDFNIIYLNTAISSGKKCDRGSLKICTAELYDILKTIKQSNDNPVIILAHHPMEAIEFEDMGRIKDTINELKISVVWLCGDYHLIFENKTYEIGELATGCFKIDSGEVAGFFVGEYTPTIGMKIQAYVGTPRGRWDYSDSYSQSANGALPNNLRQHNEFPLSYAIANQYALQGDYTNAIKLCLDTLSDEELEDEIKYKMMLELAFWYSWIDNNINAEKILSFLIQKFQKNNDKRSLARCYNYLGIVNNDMNRRAYAEYNYIQAKNIYIGLRAEISNLFKLRQEVYECYANMGLMYYRWGQSTESNEYFGSAKKYYEKALPFFEENKEILQNTAATFYNNYALFCDNQKEYNIAIDFYNRALVIKSKTVGQWHISAARIYGNKALAYYNLKDYGKAIKESKQAQRIYSDNGEAYCRDALRNLGTLASSMAMLKKYDEELELLFKIRKIRVEKYGNNDIDVAQTDHNIGKVYLEKKDYTNSQIYLINAYTIRNLKMPTHRYTIETMQLLAKLSVLQSDYKNALEWCVKIYDIQKVVLGVENKETLDTQLLINNIKRKL